MFHGGGWPAAQQRLIWSSRVSMIVLRSSWVPARLIRNRPERAGHLLPDQGLDRSGRQPICRIPASGRKIWRGQGRTHDPLDAQELHNGWPLSIPGQYEIERYRDYARKTAEKFNLRFEEIEGSPALVKKMVFGPWDDEFLVVEPGQTIQYTDFVQIQTLKVFKTFRVCNLLR